MQRDNHDEPEEQRSRPSSRRSSVSLPGKNSLKRDKDKKTPSPSHSAHSTPKRNARPSLDFMVTGKQILKRVDRANSLPGSGRRPPESCAPAPRARRISERAESGASPTSPDMSLDLSQFSDFEEGKFPLATSTPKPTHLEGYETADNHRSTPVDGNHRPTPVDGNHRSISVDGNQRSTPVDGNHRSTPVDGNLKSTAQDQASVHDGVRASPARHKPRSASLQHIQPRVDRRTKTQQSVDSSRSALPTVRSQVSVDLPSGRSRQSEQKPSRDSTFSCSRDSLFKTSSSASPYRYGTDYSSVSPEYSPSSTDLSPRAEPSPILSSCCSHSWAERTMADIAGCPCGGGAGGGGEWSSFWADYGGRAPPGGYDRCPTPYRELDGSEFEFADRRARSPTESLKQISNIIRTEGLRLSPQEAQRVIHCAHLLGSVLSRAVERSHSREDRRRTLTLNLKTENERSEPKKAEVTTQTDISLPNTKSAPKIFENILRQLSKSSLDEPDLDKLKVETE